MLTPAVQIVIAVLAAPTVVLLVRDVVRSRRPLASAATAVVVAAAGATVLTTLLPAEADTIQSLLNAPAHIAILTLLATYPNGRFVPRWTIVVVAAGAVLQIGNLATAFAWEGTVAWVVALATTWLVLLIGGQLYRFRRRSTVEERRRTGWPVLAVVVQMTSFTVLAGLEAGLTAGAGSEIGRASSYALNALIPFGFAIGLLAPDLFRVDRALRGAIAVSAVALVQLALFATATGPLLATGLSPAQGAWIGAVVVAITAWPLGIAGGRLADLVVFGVPRDPLRTLDALGERLQSQLEPDEVPRAIVAAVARGLGLSGVAVVQADGSRAEEGELDARVERFGVTYRAEELAVVLACPRPGEPELTPHDRQAIARIARQAGPALHDARAVADAFEARTREVVAREEERRRLRRDLHDDLAPTFAGLSLGAAGLSRLAADGDPRVGPLADRLTLDLGAAARQLREIAYDLRPPVLDDRGLVAAIRDRVERPDDMPAVEVIAAAGRLDLPAAVEVAALRIVQEAVMNVRRHAAASRCTVSVRTEDAALVVEVRDDGAGLPPSIREGVGLRSMRERTAALRGDLLVERLAPGTRVRVSFPVPEAPRGASPDGEADT